MHRLIPLAVLALVAMACGSGTTTETQPPATEPPATQPPATQPPATQPPETQPPETQPPATTAPDTEMAADQFVIAEVVFGSGGGVALRNIGEEAASVAGLAVCQRPSYSTLPDVVVAPGEIIWLVTGDPADLSFDPGAAPVERIGTGTFRQQSGEVGLYSGQSFGSTEAIRSYVEWGGTGHGRSSTAVGAGIWPEGGTVDTPAGTVRIISVVERAEAPEDWAPEP